MTEYVRVFKRSARSFKEFARARKMTVRERVDIEEATRLCDSFNDNRTPAQVRRGTKMEFEKL